MIKIFPERISLSGILLFQHDALSGLNGTNLKVAHLTKTTTTGTIYIKASTYPVIYSAVSIIRGSSKANVMYKGIASIRYNTDTKEYMLVGYTTETGGIFKTDSSSVEFYIIYSDCRLDSIYRYSYWGQFL